MDPVYLMIREAVLNKQVVVATYKRRRRMMCPHVLGMTNGVPHALFYQFGGESESGLGAPGSSANWRCVLVNDLRDVQVIDGDWHTCTRHTRRQTCVRVIDVEVRY